MNKFRLISLFIFLVLFLTACPSDNSVGKVSNLTSKPGAGNITVRWAFPAANNADISGFEIWRNPDKDNNKAYGVIATVNDVSKRNYTDNTANNVDTLYKYGVVVIGKDGQSGERIDQEDGVSPNPVDENTPPVATNDNYSVIVGKTLTVSLDESILANDTDADGDDLTAILVDNVDTGSLTLNNNGRFTYNSTGVTEGSDITFTYKATDGEDDSNTATVTISVTATAPDATYQTLKNTPLRAGTTATGIAIIADGLGVADDVNVDTDPANGEVTLNTDGAFTYTPDTGFTGKDSFTYTTGSATGTVTIEVLDTDIVEASSIAEVNAAGIKNIIVLAAGNYSCATGCITLKDDQILVGAGNDIAIGDLTLSTGTSGTDPALTGAPDAAITVANGVTIKGFRITSPRIGIQGGDELRKTLLIEDVVITTPEQFGINFPETDKDDPSGPDIDDDGGLYTIIINKVRVTTPKQIGIYLNDAKEIIITDTDVTGVRPLAGEVFSGQGIRLESERKTKITVENSTVTGGSGRAGPPEQVSIGFYFYKNNAFGNNPDDTGANDLMDVTLNSTSATFTTTGGGVATRAVGFRFVIQGPGGDDFEPLDPDGDNGTMKLAGTGNTSNLGGASADFSENTTPAGTANDGVFSGTVSINGTSLPSLASLRRGLLFQ